MITMDSTVRDVYNHPIGRDMLDTLLTQMGRSSRWLNNPVVGRLKLSAVKMLLEKSAPGMVDTLVHLMSEHPESPPVYTGPVRPAWWKEAVVYQIYPRSFQDTNGDGIGDLAGIQKRIPYLKALGVDVVWLSPIYDSPGDDMGYDIRNYKKIMREYGNMASFNALLAALHKNGIKLIMDLVVNHTSDEHEWFKKALEDPESPTKDYYIWAKSNRQGQPPNNWLSFFGGPAWNYYDKTDEWALHLFSKKQMDLNWDNPGLRAEIYSMVNWWLDKGVDGFRLDVINLISKSSLDDGNEAVGQAVGYRGIEQYFYGPHLHQYLQELRQNTLAGRDVFTVGETPGMGIEMCKLLTAQQRGELDMVFNFDHLDNPGKNRMTPYRYNLKHLKTYYLKWQREYGNNCWQSLFFDNHDNPRMVSKIDPNPAYREVIAKLLAVLQFTLKGTPFVYQGQELGMTNTVFNTPQDFKDVEALNRYEEMSRVMPAQQAFEILAWGARDHARTPMQWSNAPQAGFSTAEPWLDVNPNFCEINAEEQMGNPVSVFSFYQKVIALRKKHKALVYGRFHPVFLSDKNTFCYIRAGADARYYVEVNLTDKQVQRPGPPTGQHLLQAANYGDVKSFLRPYEANVYKI